MTRYILPLLLTGCASTSQQLLLTALPGPPSVVHLEPVACAEWSAEACEVILPSGLMAALPLLILHGPEATFVHEIAHCVERDYHNDFLPWIERH